MSKKMTKEEKKSWHKVWNSFLFHPVQLLLFIPFLFFVLMLKSQFLMYELEYHIVNETIEYDYFVQGILFAVIIYISIYLNGLGFNVLEKLLNKKGYSMNLRLDGKKITENSLADYILKKFDYVVSVEMIAGPSISEKKFNKLMKIDSKRGENILKK